MKQSPCVFGLFLMKTNFVSLWLNFNENKHINNFTNFDSQHHVQDKNQISVIIWKHYGKIHYITIFGTIILTKLRISVEKNKM